MRMQELNRISGYQRRSSSGVVFDGKYFEEDESKNVFPLNKVLLLLIEEEMELSFRSLNCLNKARIRLIGQLVQKSASELLALKNFGRNSLREIEGVLTAMDLTLEMKLDFPPWNGDGNGDELIQILNLQESVGGFYIDDHAAETLGIDSEELNQKLPEKNSAKSRKALKILHTKYLLDRLELKFQKDMPFLMGLIKSQRKWLVREVK